MPQAHADIIKIQNPGSTCSAGTCNGGAPFSLTAIENGTQSLGSAATYIVKDDIASITSISLDLTGTVASNQFLTIQFGGGFSGTGTLSPNDVKCTTAETTGMRTSSTPCREATAVRRSHSTPSSRGVGLITLKADRPVDIEGAKQKFGGKKRRDDDQAQHEQAAQQQAAAAIAL